MYQKNSQSSSPRKSVGGGNYSDRRIGGYQKPGFSKPGYSGSSQRSSGYSSAPRTGGYSSRPQSGSRFSRPPQRFGNGGGQRRGRPNMGQYIDPNKFINKAVITEQVEHFVPEHTFQDFKIHDVLKTSITKKGYVQPTPIQDRSIPHILRGADIVGIANTGTGKTAAFLIPLIHKVLLNPNEKVIIIAPTRELAQQIDQEFRGFSFGLKMFSVCAVGGAHIGRQINDLRRSHNFLIGTPGRLKDLIQRKFIDLSKFQTIVLDEADRMLDMGFINDMKFIMAGMPKQRHTLFFSATLSPDIEKLIQDFLKEPVKISVKTQDTSKNVDQDVIRLKPGEMKIDVLQSLLKLPEFNKVLIFGRTKHGVEKLSKVLEERGIRAESIHGDKNQSRRQKALALFKENKVQALVATDVAARGLDINGVSHVINFDIPATYEDYVHRIGRTGRGGKKGIALTFLDN
ncbi:MAG: DEAD/DEAH box helicase [Patescibacteria group bacterium]